MTVESARQMLKACLDLAPDCDIFIACAAVADYRPAVIEQQKIKKGAEELQLTFLRNPDIVATISGLQPRPFTVGFAAETTGVIDYAKDKMQRKGLDMIVANDVSDQAIGFNSDNNAATVIWSGGEKVAPLCKQGQYRRTNNRTDCRPDTRAGLNHSHHSNTQALLWPDKNGTMSV